MSVTMYAISDSIGETAERVALAAACQFKTKITVKRISYMKTMETVSKFIDSLDSKEKVIIVSTIVLADVREFLTQRCIGKGIAIVNVLGPIMNVTSSLIGEMPEYNPGAVWNVDEQYYKRIEAMEFAIQYDDSKDYSGIEHADVVLVGLSRTSKTPLSMYLANKGLKTLNVPLIPEVPVPESLFKINRKKIFGLQINPLELIEIRKNRLGKYASHSCIEYADDARILEELDYADKIIKRLGCKTIDVTKRAIEDTALIILNSINKDNGNKEV